ncbi:MAG TPA: SurA N-terminal domain-containing protein [Candidatus Hydrogenedentes bacterium]|nr:SurA N-terminal domain-containing protein [Candidatus Hydrogenedentota bacterium]
MQEWMRKHRRLFFIVIFLFIGVPMVFFFGLPSSGRSRRAAGEDREVIRVGNVPIQESEFRRQLDATARMIAQMQGGERPSNEELERMGMVTRVTDQLVNSTLLTMETQSRNLPISDAIVQEQLRGLDMFKDENGKFMPAAYNEWVQSVRDWTPIYEDMRKEIARNVLLRIAGAPGRRVSKTQVDEELIADHTRFTAKFLKVEAPVGVTDEMIQKEYSEHPERYRKSPTITAEFLAISLLPPVPQKALDAVARARAGEDFAALVNELSDLKIPEGGDQGWRPVDPDAPAHLQPLFALKPGEVSDPVAGPTGYFIYKVDEERMNDQGQREIKWRQILINAELTEAELSERRARAQSLETEAKQIGLLQAAANAGLEVRRTNPFTQETQNIENVDRVDVPQFRSALISEKEMNVPRTIPARNNVYVAQVVERAEGELRPLEEVREDVARNVIAARKQEDSYREETRALANQLKKEYSSLDEIVVKRPDLGAEVKATSTPFSRRDPLYNQQLFLDSMQLYQEFKDVEPGTIVGPVNGLLGDMWLAQLVEKQVPQAADLAQFADERKQIVDRLKQTEEGNYVNDYIQHLRRQRLASMPLTVQQDIIDEIIGKDRQNTTEETPAETGDTAQESPAASDAEIGSNTSAPAPAAAEGSQ